MGLAPCNFEANPLFSTHIHYVGWPYLPLFFFRNMPYSTIILALTLIFDHMINLFFLVMLIKDCKTRGIIYLW